MGRVLAAADPEEAEPLAERAQEAVDQRWDTYEEMASHGPARYPPTLGREADRWTSRPLTWAWS
jgi:hypothetical protein